jgi:ATP-binding cassette, subfamily B (MDR/TAP), member 1
VGNPKILLLDEATSALDAESELIVQEALDSILVVKKITTIIMAHRLSTIRKANVIHVIVGGEVVESGTHNDLMASRTYYRKLVDKQEGAKEGMLDEEYTTPQSSRASNVAGLASVSASVTISTGTEEYESVVGRSGTNIMHKRVGMPLNPHIRFNHVMFAYPTRPTKQVFNDLNLTIYQGQTVALVGPSGSGKSTTVGLIERFYDPIEGVLEYMGHDVKTLNVAWYRDQIGYVGQEPVLFNDTIAHNIAYGAPGATQKEIEKAAVQANAHDFIMEFSQGYETPVGERGTQLSGGQKQRIAIARALVKNPKILIIDEATSALDSESEAVVQAAIDKLMHSRGQTVIVIAHRLSTIRNADSIVVIADGKVVENGTHDDLLSQNGRYRHLVESSKRSATVANSARVASNETDEIKKDDEDATNWEEKIEEEEKAAFSSGRAYGLMAPFTLFLFIGSIGAVMAGGVFPMWGILFAETIDILFRPVFMCPSADGVIPDGYLSCDAYWNGVSDEMRKLSYKIAGYWAIVMLAAVLGNMLTFWGFGQAAERLNKRLRDKAFTSLLR